MHKIVLLVYSHTCYSHTITNGLPMRQQDKIWQTINEWMSSNLEERKDGYFPEDIITVLLFFPITDSMIISSNTSRHTPMPHASFFTRQEMTSAPQQEGAHTILLLFPHEKPNPGFKISLK